METIEKISALISRAEADLAASFAQIDERELKNTEKILGLYKKYEVAARHFAPTTGYGYDDIGRDTLEKIFADLFGAEAAIVRG